jgi:single-strand DNA-binding protein
MSSLNKIVLIGSIETAPELKATNAGDSVINFSLSVDRPQRADGTQGGTDSIKIVAWREKAEFAANLTQGTLILVEGRIQTRSYDNDEGQRIYVTEVEARELKPLAGSDVAGIQTAAVSASTKETAASPEPVIETKTVDDASNFDFTDDSAELSSPPEFGNEVEEDIPF